MHKPYRETKRQKDEHTQTSREKDRQTETKTYAQTIQRDKETERQR